MAESGGEKTEQATPERLRRSREEGRIPVSQELPHGIIIGAMFLLAALTARGLLRWICSVIRHDLSPSVELVQNPDLLWGAIHSRFVESFWHLAPFAVAGVAASVLVSVLGSGAAVCPKALRIKLERISPSYERFNLIFENQPSQISTARTLCGSGLGQWEISW